MRKLPLRSRMVYAMARTWYEDRRAADPNLMLLTPPRFDDATEETKEWTLDAMSAVFDSALDVLGETLGTKPLLMDPHRLVAVMRA